MADARNSGQYTAVMLPHAESRCVPPVLLYRRSVLLNVSFLYRIQEQVTVKIWYF